MHIQPPGRFQKFAHNFLMQRAVSALLAIVLHRADAVALRITRGRHTITGIVGLPVIQLNTIGAKTGRQRTSPLVGHFDGERIALIGSNFGKKNNPGWYHNLKADPQCTVHFNGRTRKYIARLPQGEEREKYWKLALMYYKGYELYQVRALPYRIIPVMVLEPVKSLPR